jgi:hypothetical protein
MRRGHSRSPKKIALCRETLRALEPETMRDIAGGYTVTKTPTGCGTCITCNTQCHPKTCI